MSVLITGGTGFIGLNLADALLAAGERVVLAGLLPPPPGWGEQFGGRLIALPLDIRHAQAVDAVLRDYEVTRIVHAAAITPGPERERHDGREVLDVNILGTQSVLEAAERHPIRRVIVLSNPSVFGPHAYVSDPLTEDAPTRPDTLLGISTFAAEGCALRARALSGLDAVVLRLPALFGPWERDSGHNDRLSPQWQIARALADGTRDFVLPRPGMQDWTYVPDAAAAIGVVLGAPQPKHGLYHLGSGQRWSIADWLEAQRAYYPDLTVRLTADPAEATVDLHSRADRAPLSPRRFIKEFGVQAGFDIAAAASHYAGWLRDHPGLL